MRILCVILVYMVCRRRSGVSIVGRYGFFFFRVVVVRGDVVFLYGFYGRGGVLGRF